MYYDHKTDILCVFLTIPALNLKVEIVLIFLKSWLIVN
jgi:hypothetical protein